MATDNRTGEVKSYFGQPCSIAPLIAVRTDPHMGDDFDRLRKDDPRHVVQLLGSRLANMEQRTGYQLEVLDRAHTMAAELDSDALELEAILAVLREYALHTANAASEVTTYALAVLDHADLIAPSQQVVEVAHG